MQQQGDNYLSVLLSRPVGLTMALLVFLGWGALSLWQLPVGLQPSVEYPALSVITRYPGMHGEKIEQILTRPIEERILGAGGIRDMFSVSEEGESRINLILEPNVDVSLKSLEIQDRISMISETFPREAEEPTVVRYDPSQKPVIILRLDSDAHSLLSLREFAEKKVKPYLQRIEGTSEINIGGGKQREIKVLVSQRALAVSGLPISSVMQAIQENNLELPAGELNVNDQKVALRILGYIEKPEEIESIPVAALDSERLLTVSSIARVEDSYREPDSISRENGREVVTVYIHRASGANLVDLSEQFHRSLNAINWQGIQYDVSYDEAEFVKDAISSVWIAIFQGAFASFVVLWLFLGTWRAAVAIAAAIPISIILQFILLRYSGVGLNSVSMTALALGVGMLTDSAILIIEYASRLSLSVGSGKAVIMAVGELWRELVASVGTTIAVFFPIFFASFEVKVEFLPLAITLSGALIVSLIVTLTIIPVLLHKIPGTLEAEISSGSRLSGLAVGTHSIAQRVEGTFQRINERWSVILQNLYSRYAAGLQTLHQIFLRFPGLLLPSIILFSMLGGIAFLALPQKAGSSGPGDRIRASVELEPGTNLEATDRIVARVVGLFSQDPDVTDVMTKVEKWRADLFLTISDPDDSQDIVERLEGKAREVPEAQVFFLDNESLSDRQEVNIEINGSDLDTLLNLSREAAKALKSLEGVEQVVYRFKPGKPEYIFQLDDPALMRTGLSAASIASNLKTAVDGSIPTKYIEAGREFDIRVQMVKELRTGPEIIGAYPFNLKDNTVPLAELARAGQGQGKGKIYRKNKQRQLSLTAVLTTDNLPDKVEELEAGLARSLDLPEGYFIEFTGKHEDIQENRRQMLLILASALILMFSVLALLFESLRIPLAILSILPPGLALVFFVLLAFSVSLNPGVYVGLVLLIGLIVNNSIVLVSEIRSAGEGSNPVTEDGIWQLVSQSATRRFRPILMTSLTTITGLLPLLLSPGAGADLWRPLALTGCIGILASMLLGLFLVPIFCYRYYSFFFHSQKP